MDEKFIDFFDETYLKNYTKLLQYAYRNLCDMHTAEDIVEELFIVFLHKIKILYTHPNVAGWLYKTMQNLIHNEKKKKRNSEIEFNENLNFVESGIRQDKLVDTLPPGLTANEIQILILRYEQKLEYDEIADILGIKQIACRARLSRSKKKYEKLMKNF